ncbi:MAG: thioredoxin [Candidatus Nomurabacteria bacterium]|nr:MAG: thioredoxin [Candidatus Nomurabacteria bacterium]
MALYNTTTKQEFEEKVLKSDKVVLVDFWAAWCPPCRAMSPALISLADKLDDTTDVVKVNIEESADNNALAGEHGVQSIPNMIVYKAGKQVDNIIGMVPESTLREQLTAAAAK